MSLPVLSSFAPENPEDGEMYPLVLAHPGSPGHSPESHKMVVVVVVVPVAIWLGPRLTALRYVMSFIFHG